LQHPIADPWPWNSWHLLWWLCSRHPEGEALRQLDHYFCCSFFSGKLQHNLSRSSHDTRFDISKLVFLCLELSASCLGFGLR
jgi:hypothetical protein